MIKKRLECTVKENFRIIVFPTSLLWGAPLDLSHTCQQIVKEIERHVDHVENTCIKWDTVCKFCKSIWEVNQRVNGILLDEDLEEDEPLCCSKAQEAFNKEN